MRPDIVQQYPFIDKWRAKGFQYLIVPKAMLGFGKSIGISCEEAVLYALLKDRAKLSVKNKWFDADGRVFLTYTREEAARKLGCSLRKTVDVFASLVQHGLLYEEERKDPKRIKIGKRLYPKMWMDITPTFRLQDIKDGNFPFMTKSNFDADTGSYYIIPMVLLEDETFCGLSLRATLLYVIALEHLHMSLMYEQVDENGLVWTTLDSKELLYELDCSLRTLTTAYKELETIGLLERKKTGYAGEYRIYLRDYLPAAANLDAVPTPSAPPQDMNADFARHARKECTSYTQNLHDGPADSAPQYTQNLHANHPFPSQPFSQPFLASIPAGSRHAEEAARKEEILSEVKQWIDYDRLLKAIQVSQPEGLRDERRTVADIAVEAMTRDLCHAGTHIRIGNDTYRVEALRREYEQTDCFTFYAMVDKIVQRLDSIKDLNLYVHSAIATAHQKHASAAVFYRRELEGEDGRQRYQKPPHSSPPNQPPNGQYEQSIYRAVKNLQRDYGGNGIKRNS